MCITGGAHSLLLKADGTVWGTGSNWAGQLGSISRGGATSFVQVFAEKVISVSAGFDHSLAVMQDGSMFGSGRNYNGQLDASKSNDNRREFTKIISANVHVTAGGDYYSMILKKDGTVWGAGYNNKGQLGLSAHQQKTFVEILDAAVTPLPVLGTCNEIRGSLVNM